MSSTFSQWWNTFQRSQKVHDHYYICGVEVVLRMEVLDTIVRRLDVPDWNYQRFDPTLNSEDAIWERLFRTNFDTATSISVVLNAEKLKKKELLPKLVKLKPSSHVVIFVTSEERVERIPVPKDGGGFTHELPDWLEGFEKKGKIIECIPFTNSTAKTAVAWVKSKVDVKEGAAADILNAANGDLRVVKDTILKLQWIGEVVTPRNVYAMLHEHPKDTFTDAMLSTDKGTALDALKKMPTSEYLQVIGHLDAQVDLAGRVHDMLASHKTVKEIMIAVGGQAFLVPTISKVARHYSKPRIINIRKLLAEADRRLRRGVVDGVMESLVVLW